MTKSPEIRLENLKKRRGEDYSEAVSLYRLTVEEALIISDFADRSGYVINDKLIEESKEEDVLEKEKLLNLALDKLVPFNYKTVFVDFKINEAERQVYTYNWYKANIGKVIKFPTFLSSTRNREKFKNRNFYLEIKTSYHNSSGRYIAPLTGHKTEEEVTFKSKSNFIITRVESSPYTIYLKEVERSRIPDYILRSGYLELDNYK